MRKKARIVLLVVVFACTFSGWTGSWPGASARQADFPGEFADDNRTIVINDNNQVLVLSCTGAAVSVNGNHNTLTLLGTCSSLAVHGNKNRITLEARTVVTDTGNNNIITIPGPPAATTAPTVTPLKPTNSPPVATRTPAPTYTAPVPAQTLPPTSTAPVPTGTPPPDTEAPTVRWIAPVPAGERYDLRDGEQVLLEAGANDNTGVVMVRFLWWDAAHQQYVVLGSLLLPPYRLPVNASALNPEWNQVFVIASDQAQNSSDYPFIWLYRTALRGSQPGYQVFLPFTGK